MKERNLDWRGPLDPSTKEPVICPNAESGIACDCSYCKGLKANVAELAKTVKP